MRSLASSLLVLVALSACGKSDATSTAAAEAGGTPVKVETATVETQKMPKYLTLTGSILADKQSELAANVAGRITAVYVERGQPVKMGQPIAAVDAKAASLQAAAATAQSQAADTQVDLAKQDCARADTLYAKGVLPQSEYDRQKTQCTAQLYNANAARAQADLAGKLAGDTVVRSPIDGVVGERFVNVGEYVQPSSRVASVFSVKPVRVSISVPEPVVGQVQVGQRLNVRVAAHPGRDFPAVVRYVSPALREHTRDLIIEAFAPNEDQLLLPGMFATVLLAVGEEDLATVPTDALKVEGTARRIYLAKEGMAYEMVVRTGVEKDGRIAILDTFAAGDRVIVKPPAEVRDGTRIQ